MNKKTIIVLGLTAIFHSTANAQQPLQKLVPITTAIKCQTFEAKIISTCEPTYTDVPMCELQTLEIGNIKKILLGKKKNQLERHASAWECVIGTDKKEYISLYITNWFDAQEETSTLITSKGETISKKLENKIDPPAGNRRITSKGRINLPAME